ncbi:MAG TPA: hypothetical protein VFD08_06610 [Clostridia bacterium]|nr:hypothetical protein [Clostridia bacterium]
MNRREKYKARKIVDELTGYLLRNNINSLSIYLDFNEERVEISLWGQLTKEIPNLETLISLMNARRVPEMEDYYEQLLGTGIDDNDINILGAMVDKATYTLKEDRLEIKVVRYL